MVLNAFPHLSPRSVTLAPMEGVTDAPMRALISQLGGFSYCVSEFLRISQEVPPDRIFREHMPELRHEGRTPGGMPVVLQLLGGDAEKLAESAARGCALGAPGIDLNFGCPAPTVNRHDGGATLLKYPLRIRAIVEAVRKAVPAHLPVSVKMRLGWDSLDPVHENSEMAAQGGASWITIHGRTRLAGYIPPAYWRPIGEVQKRLAHLPIIANGEIWTIEDFLRCREETACNHYMLGRGALADPWLAFAVSRELGLPVPASADHIEGRFPSDARSWAPLLRQFADVSLPLAGHPSYVTRRIKQWIKYAHLNRGLEWFDRIKRIEGLPELLAALDELPAPTETPPAPGLRTVPENTDTPAAILPTAPSP